MNKKEELIKFIHFKTLLTSQPYFIWNDFEKKQNDNNDFINSLEEKNSTDFFWEIFLNSDEEKDVQISSTVQKKLEAAFYNFISKNFNKERIYINNEMDLEKGIKITENILNKNSSDYDLIINPVFKYKNAITKLSFYNLKAKKIGTVKFTTSTKLSDYLKAYYEYSIASKFIKIHAYSIFILNYKDLYKKDEVDFYETFFANTTKTKRSAKPELQTKEKKAIYAGEKHEKNTIFEKITNNNFSKILNEKLKKEIFFSDFDSYLNDIENAKKINTLDIVSLKDYTKWGENRYLSDLLLKDYPEIANYSGKIITKKEILSNNSISLEEKLKTSFVFQKIKEGKNIIDYQKINNILKDIFSNKRIIWYDFESYSLPYPAIDNYLPYKHIPFQLSLIETQKQKIIRKNNWVYDTLNYDINNFIEIIDQIYSKKANKFIVYNKSYENTRLKEMLENLQFSENKLSKNINKLKKMSEKVTYIINNTIDLADLFIINSKKGTLPPIFIPELNGYYSIKKIENFINKHKIKLKNNIKSYKNLNVQNGLMAMELGIKRALNIIGDLEWEKIKNDLKDYCENDVRAMLMVFDFALYVQKNWYDLNKKD